MKPQSTKVRNILLGTMLSGATLLGTTMGIISGVDGVAHAQTSSTTASANTVLSARKVEVFSDFECPACKRFAPRMKELELSHKGRLEVDFRNYPLPQHKNAELAARVAEAAGLQGQFNQMHDLLFARQEVWSKHPKPTATFISYAKELGLDLTKFKKDMQSSSVKQKIAADIAAGDAVGLEATPTVVVDGTKYSGKQLLELGKVIDESSQPKAKL